MRKTVYVLGNPAEPLDQPAVNLLPKLIKNFPQINFIRFDPTEELPQDVLKEELIIIDTIVGLKRVTKFDGLDYWNLSPRVTVHDYDIPISVGILRKLGKINKITIIGIPQNQEKEEVIKEIDKILKGF